MTNRYEWLRYREALYRVALGVRANDPACVEIATRYIELRYIGSYSGFIRAKLARSLKSARLTERQRERLNAHFLRIVLDRDYTQEFRSYLALWERIIDGKCLSAVKAHFGKRSQHKGNSEYPAGASRVQTVTNYPNVLNIPSERGHTPLRSLSPL